jgi:hypothetical protein
LGLGGGLGLVLAVLVELLNRRVRGIEDLDLDGGVACLAVVGSAAPKRHKGSDQSGMTPGAVVGANA